MNYEEIVVFQDLIFTVCVFGIIQLPFPAGVRTETDNCVS